MDNRHEKTIMAVIAVVILMLILSQVLVLNHDGRLANKSLWEYRGSVLGKVEYLYDHGFIILELQGKEPEPCLYVLKNGVRVANFENTRIRLDVIQNDVIEIDASETVNNVTVKITGTNMPSVKGKVNHSLTFCGKVGTLLIIK